MGSEVRVHISMDERSFAYALCAQDDDLGLEGSHVAPEEKIVVRRGNRGIALLRMES